MLKTTEQMRPLWSTSSPRYIGQLFIADLPEGGFSLCHRDDQATSDLMIYHDAWDALAIAKFDDHGKYRPLKTAPNLRHGWRLELLDSSSVCLALDLFYPGRLRILAAERQNAMVTTPLRETLGRQSGMYRIATRLTDAQADELVGRFCRSSGGSPGCLRTILWKGDATGSLASTRLPAEKFDPSYDQTGGNQRTMPLLCQEACNLLVAEARAVVKDEGESTAARS